MVDLREALLKAARTNPQNPLARQVRQAAADARIDEHQDRRFEAIGRRYNALGNAQYQIAMRPVSYRGESDANVWRSQWRELQREFPSYPPVRQAEVLMAFAKGLRVNGTELDARYRDFFEMAESFGVPIRKQNDSQFTRQASIFLSAIAFYEQIRPEGVGTLIALSSPGTLPLDLERTIPQTAAFLARLRK